MAERMSKAAALVLKSCGKTGSEAILEVIDAQIKGGNLPESEKICPECGRNLSIINVGLKTGDLQLEGCVFCKSLWFDEGELKGLTGFSKDIPADNLAHRKSKYHCPQCRQLMREYLFIQKENLLVDKCPENHGIYLESGELKRVFSMSQ